MKFGKIAVALLAFAVVLGFSACSRSSSITRATDLDGKKVGVQEGSTSESWVKENLRSATITTYKAVEDAAVDLRRGVLDAVVTDETVARELAASYKNLQILTNAGSFSREEYGIAVMKGNTELLTAVNAAIQKARASGEYDLLYSSFITPDGGNITIPTLNIPAIGGGRTIRLGTESAFPPFEYMEGGNVVGFDISLGQLIAREYGANLEVVDMEFHRLLPTLVTGGIDLIAAAMTITDERKEIVDFSVPYFSTELVILVKE